MHRKLNSQPLNNTAHIRKTQKKVSKIYYNTYIYITQGILRAYVIHKFHIDKLSRDFTPKHKLTPT